MPNLKIRAPPVADLLEGQDSNGEYNEEMYEVGANGFARRRNVEHAYSLPNHLYNEDANANNDDETLVANNSSTQENESPVESKMNESPIYGSNNGRSVMSNSRKSRKSRKMRKTRKSRKTKARKSRKSRK